MRQLHLLFLTLLLCAIGLGLAAYKVNTLGLPLTASAQTEVWNVEARISIPEIAYAMQEADDNYSDGLDELQKAIEKHHNATLALTRPQATPSPTSTKTETAIPASTGTTGSSTTQTGSSQSGSTQTIQPVGVNAPPPSRYVVSRPVEMKVREAYGRMNLGAYLENEQDVEQFVSQLKAELLAKIENHQKIRIL